MNRLQDMRGYLGGAMEFAEGLGIEWRANIQNQTKELGVIWLDPTDKPIDIGTEDVENHEARKKLKNEGRYDEVANTMKVIRCVDLRMVDLADFLIINLDIKVHTSGTYEELFLANRQKKPIILRVKQGKCACPDWLFATIPHQMIFTTWDEILGYLEHIAGDPIIEHRKRWYFFDFKKIEELHVWPETPSWSQRAVDSAVRANKTERPHPAAMPDPRGLPHSRRET